MYENVELGVVARELIEALPKGVLLTTKADGKVNSMTIAWGFIGYEWNRPVFVALVREGRFTNELLKAHGEFTVNIPHGAFDKKILGLCGSRSGRTTDKIAEAGLTLASPRTIAVPGIVELPLTLECRVLYAQTQQLDLLEGDLRADFYPADVDSSFHGANRDAHVAYYGEIVDSYLIQQ